MVFRGSISFFHGRNVFFFSGTLPFFAVSWYAVKRKGAICLGQFGAIESDGAARRIAEAAARGTLSHALLITGGGDRTALARYAAAAMECSHRGARPCGECSGCRKVLRDIHPDVVTVRDDAHRQIAADVVRTVRSDAWIQPNEGARKVYLFPDCSLLTERDQNILLKVVEEGPPYAAFLFCAENGAAVLQTLRSRCVELKLRPGGEEVEAARMLSAPPSAADPALMGAELCRRIAAGRGAVVEFAARAERKRLDREELGQVLIWCREAFAAALLSLYGQQPEEAYREIGRYLASTLTKRRLAFTIDIMGKYAAECQWNIGPGHILGALAAELEGAH